MKRLLETRFLFLYGVLFVILITLPYILNGTNAIITYHDFLDSTIAHLKSIVNNGLFFKLSGTLPLMNGVDRLSVAYTSPFEFKSLLFAFLSPYWAIVTNIFLVKVCAFTGMFLLLNKYVSPNHRGVNFLISILFCLVPFYVDYGISSAGIPLVTYALQNLRNRNSILTSFAIVLFYAVYSSLPLSGFFVCVLLFARIIYIFIKEKEINSLLIIALACLSTVYIVTNWSIIYGYFFSPATPSHRTEWVNLNSASDLFLGFIHYNLAISNYHAGEFIAWPIVLTFIVIFFIYKHKDNSLQKYMNALILLTLLTATGTLAVKLPSQVFTSFCFHRFSFLYPALCFVLLAKSVTALNSTFKRIPIYVLLILSFYCVWSPNWELKKNFSLMMGKEITKYPSYRQFYDEALFQGICEDLGISQDYSTKVVSVGLYPAIAEYNGLWSLDGYMNSYSLDYKHKFRRIIAKELEKDESIKQYFDYWGCRCYLFSSEIGRNYAIGKNDSILINSLDIDTDALKELECKYILSSVEIHNYENLGLSFINSYTSEQSFFKIYVYSLG